GDFIGNSEIMLDVYRQLTKVAASDYTVLIQGESGSGKELVAQAIHQLSDRKEQAFVSINCAAIPENLLESELFGYEKGAFTGATQNKAGKFELAHKGTLFLDEIGDMPLALQVKLLRILEDGRIQPLGSVREKKVDIRLVTATHRNLLDQIQQGLFREDLHYRLNVIPLQLPPLRDRTSDLPLLVLHFLEKLLRGEDQTIQRVAWDLFTELRTLDLKGNVRELENLLTRSVFQTDGDLLTREALLSGTSARPSVGHPAIPHGAGAAIQPLWQLEKEALQRALELLDGNISQAAVQLQISRTAIYRKIKKYGLDYTQPETHAGADHA
ncbi:MAG: sigma-54 dependent transcriptional regulator, partial [Candidatus Marinimicrobia bacterium]|nr:sigma-54 dependent transcriptional regulator [Candidatus Neomarinimicrobiota bacterium]